VRARAGFCELVPPSLISLFTPEELELLIAGLPDIDVADLKRHTEYLGYRPTDEAVQFFWQAVESFDASDRARLLMFVTGTSKVPLGGFKALRGQRGPQLFTLQKAGGDPEALPASHTCFVSRRPPLRPRARARALSLSLSRARTFLRVRCGAPWRSPLTATCAAPPTRHAQNQLDLPPYRDADTMRDKLLVAVRECGEGFGFA
jgi:hypothetical protein